MDNHFDKIIGLLIGVLDATVVELGPGVVLVDNGIPVSDEIHFKYDLTRL
jgi:hypothetical protein